MAQGTGTSKQSANDAADRQRRACPHVALHGGKSRKGAASTTFVHGRRSRYLPARLLERYQRALEDPELREFRHDLALVETRLSELLERIDARQSADLWEMLRAKFREMKKSTHDERTRDTAMADLGQLIDEGISDSGVWNEVVSLLEQRRKVLESESKRLATMHLRQRCQWQWCSSNAIRRECNGESTNASRSCGGCGS